MHRPHYSQVVKALTISICAGFLLVVIIALILVTLPPEFYRYLLGLIVAFLFLSAVVVLSLYLARYFFKTVPDGFAAVIIREGQRVEASIDREVFVKPFIERIEWIDMRSQTLETTFECATADNIKVAIRVLVDWSIDPQGLLQVLNATFKPADVIRQLMAAQLVFEVNRRTLDQVQMDIGEIRFRLERYVCRDYRGAPRYHLLVTSPQITSVKLPAEIEFAAAQVKRKELERKLAQIERGMTFAQRVSQASAHSIELKKFNEAVSVVNPRTVEHSEVITGVVKRAEEKGPGAKAKS